MRIRREQSFVRVALRLTGAVLAAAALLPPVPAQARTWTISMKDCFFSTTFRAVDPGDTVRWTYDERPGDDCATFNHRIESFGSVPDGKPINSGPCASITDPAFTCLNDPPKQSMFARTFTVPGTYNYFCRFHGIASGDPTKGNPPECGMCGQIRVVGATGSPTVSASPTPSRRPTASPTATVSPTVTPTGTITVSPSGTATATVSPTGTATVIAGGEEDDDKRSGGGRALIAVAAISALGSAGYLVWRLFLRAG